MMVDWVVGSRLGKRSRSCWSSCCVLSSPGVDFFVGTAGPSNSSVSKEVADDSLAAALLPRRLRKDDARYSAGSNIGEGSSDLSSSDESCRSSTSTVPDFGLISCSSVFPNFPPCMGGTKSLHRPSMLPIWNLNMNSCVSNPWKAFTSSVASRPTICRMALSPPGW